MAVTSDAVGVACTMDENAFCDGVEMEVNVPRRRNIAEGLSFDSIPKS